MQADASFIREKTKYGPCEHHVEARNNNASLLL
jgi:hypothetical protein